MCKSLNKVSLLLLGNRAKLMHGGMGGLPTSSPYLTEFGQKIVCITSLAGVSGLRGKVERAGVWKISFSQADDLHYSIWYIAQGEQHSMSHLQAGPQTENREAGPTKR